jgi:lysophospholipase L1-like esterase
MVDSYDGSAFVSTKPWTHWDNCGSHVLASDLFRPKVSTFRWAAASRVVFMDRARTSPPITVGSRLNLTPINVGFDGGYAGILNYPNLDELSLCWLVDAITSGDWSAQERAIASLDPVNAPILSRIRVIDFSKVTHIALEYGTNDFTLAMPIGKNTDETKETFKGSLNYSIRKMLTSFPQLHLILIAPSWRLNFEDLDSDTHPNAQGIFLKGYVDAMLEVAALNHVPCLDMWRTLGLNINNYKSFTFDGTHPNKDGAIRRGEAIASFMNSVF